LHAILGPHTLHEIVDKPTHLCQSNTGTVLGGALKPAPGQDPVALLRPKGKSNGEQTLPKEKGHILRLLDQLARPESELMSVGQRMQARIQKPLEHYCVDISGRLRVGLSPVRSWNPSKRTGCAPIARYTAASRKKWVA